MTRRRAVAAARSLARRWWSAVGCASQTDLERSAGRRHARPVNGLLLDGGNRPLPDQIVAIGAEKTTSNGEGRFAFASVPVHYDLVVASPDGRSRRSTRASPAAIRSSCSRHRPSRAGAHGVDRGDAGGRRRRAEAWRIYFVSARASEVMGDKPPAAAGDKTRHPEPLVVAVGRHRHGLGCRHRAVDAQVEKLAIPLALFAQQAVTLRAGQTACDRAAPDEGAGRAAPVARRGRAQGGSRLRSDLHRGVSPARRGLRDARPRPGSGPYEIPDLTRFGLQLCAHAFQWQPCCTATASSAAWRRASRRPRRC